MRRGLTKLFDRAAVALPTPIDPAVDRLTVPQQEQQSEDPLQRWRQLQEERLNRERQKQQDQFQANVSTTQDTAQTEAIQALSDAMSQQMQAILESQNQIAVNNMQITDPNFLKTGEDGSTSIKGSGQDDDADADTVPLEPVQTILLPAGEIVYAQLLTEANSDVPGPILAEIMSGPLLGSRVLGSFEVANELLILRFNTVIIDGTSIAINAVAVDPGTTLTAMATDVDHRYFKRIVLPMAAAFVEGMAEAISESGRTTVTIQGETVAEETSDTDTKQEVSSGIEEAGAELGDILDDMADDIETLVRVESGTPMGILFLEPVIEEVNAP